MGQGASGAACSVTGVKAVLAAGGVMVSTAEIHAGESRGGSGVAGREVLQQGRSRRAQRGVGAGMRCGAGGSAWVGGSRAVPRGAHLPSDVWQQLRAWVVGGTSPPLHPPLPSLLSSTAVLQSLDGDGKIMLDGEEFYITH